MSHVQCIKNSTTTKSVQNCAAFGLNSAQREADSILHPRTIRIFVQGATRKKLEAASGAILQYVGNTICYAGSTPERGG